MKNYDVNLYKYVVHDKGDKREVIAITTYAGKTIKGIAKCNPSDTYSLQKGKDLAAARCSMKVAKKRSNRAAQKWNEAQEQLHRAYDYVAHMNTYLADAKDELTAAEENLNKIYSEM